MSTSTIKKQKIKYLTKGLFWIIFLNIIIIGGYVFMFIYKNIYFAIIEETAIINLKTELVINKVQKQNLESILNFQKNKINPTTSLNFTNIKNPFKTANPEE